MVRISLLVEMPKVTFVIRDLLKYVLKFELRYKCGGPQESLQYLVTARLGFVMAVAVVVERQDHHNEIKSYISN